MTETYFQFYGGLTGLYCPSSTSPGCQNGSQAAGEFNSSADFLLGLPQSASNSELTVNWVTLRSWQFAPYISDTWQVSKKLTLYMGTSWDYLPVPRRENRGIEFYNTDTNQFQFCGLGKVSGDCGISVQKNLFSPRADFAYRVKPNTVFRRVYSLAPEQISMARDALYNYPSTVTQRLSGTNSYVAATTLTKGFPTLSPPDISAGTITLPSDIGVAWPAKNFILGYTESYNAALQQELGWNLLAQVGYVGTLTVHQHTRANIHYALVAGAQAPKTSHQTFPVTAPLTDLQPFE